jgi:hypothetical protein
MGQLDEYLYHVVTEEITCIDLGRSILHTGKNVIDLNANIDMEVELVTSRLQTGR